MIEASPRQSLFFQWLSWRFFAAPRSIARAFRNFLIFNFRYFSIAQLAKTLFAHWRRYRETYPRGFSPGKYFHIFLGNTLSRFIGAIIRSLTILAGLLLECLIFLGGLATLLAWIFLPLLVVAMCYLGIQFLGTL